MPTGESSSLTEAEAHSIKAQQNATNEAARITDSFQQWLEYCRDRGFRAI
jgi:hypothetical protein